MRVKMAVTTVTDAGEVVLIHSLQQPSSNDLNEYFSKRFLAK